MAIKLGQSLKQTQSLMMTPQLQQAIKLLTLTHLEMTNLISSEMVENPMLEEMGSESSVDESNIKEVDYNIEKLSEQNKEATSDAFNEPDVMGGKDDFDWNKYIESYNSSSSSAPSMAKGDHEDSPNYENMVSRGMSLPEHLEWQLRMESLTQSEWEVANLIIHNINDEGYLEVNFQDIINESGHDPEDALELLHMIQKLDPVGCGARDLKECLLIQARELIPRLPLVETLISDHLEDINQKDYAKISKETGVSTPHIKEAEIIILGLNPKPGRLVSADAIEYIVPDIYIKEVGGELVVHLNDDGVPRLKISNLYKNLLSKGMGDDASKEFVEDKLRSALWLIKSIQNRQRTIVKVTEAILKYQPEFFKKGAQYLKPMILKDIAQEIGMHESTVSRVTTNKYVHTPIGIFELKYFFNTGVGGKNGGIDVASESLKLKIKQLVGNENPRKPLSDQKIADVLADEGINIARRTVAKYREQLNILPSSKRKKRS